MRDCPMGRLAHGFAAATVRDCPMRRLAHGFAAATVRDCPMGRLAHGFAAARGGGNDTSTEQDLALPVDLRAG